MNTGDQAHVNAPAAMTEIVITSISDALARLVPATTHTLTVAFSGGVDSTVLLHAANAYASANKLALSACYVHHGLSANASAWQAHCASVCRQLDVDFDARSVSVVPKARQSTEALAREARYAALAEHCRQRQSVLLLGQHQDDQLETVLLQLKRGAGPQGLAAMPDYQVKDGIVMLRPMLNITRKQIEVVAQTLSLEWVDDESNADVTYDRNFLRQQIIPLLQSRWPAFSETATRSAALCAEQQQLVEQAAAEKLHEVSKSAERIDGIKLMALPAIWQRAILRAWFSAHNVPAPSQAQLEQVMRQLVAKDDAQPQVTINKVVIRRFQQDLFWTQETPARQVAAEQSVDVGSPTYLKGIDINLHISDASAGHAYRLLPVSLNEKVKPQGKRVSKPIKQWMKSLDIPPWQRQPAALLLMNDRPVACIYPAGVLALHELPPDVQIRAS